MSDIAILVVEEYERRVRQPEDSKTAMVDFDWWKKFPGKLMTVGVHEKKIESFMKKFEAKSQFAIAISHGVFSA